MPPCSALQRVWDSLENLEPRPVEDLQVYCKTQTYQPVPQVGRQNSPRAEFRTFGLCETCYWQTIKIVRIMSFALLSESFLPACHRTGCPGGSERKDLFAYLTRAVQNFVAGRHHHFHQAVLICSFPTTSRSPVAFFTSLQRSTVGRQSGVPFCCCWGVLLRSCRQCSAERATSIGGGHLLVGWQPGRSAGVWEKGRALGVLRCPDQWVIKISTFIKRF